MLCFICIAFVLCSLNPLKTYAANEKKNIYTVYVNKTTNSVHVVTTNDDGSLNLIKAFSCSVGRKGHDTPEGTFKADGERYEWRLMVDGTYGRYAVRIFNKIMFHSVPYVRGAADALEWDQYNLLGQRASLGCIRLCSRDAKWIYDNISNRTTVVIYSDEKNIGDFETPYIAPFSDKSAFKNWDPTDYTVGNPWIEPEHKAFDDANYIEQNPDIVEEYGTDRETLWAHFVTLGIYEGRSWR